MLSLFLQQMGRSHRLSGILVSGIGLQKTGWETPRVGWDKSFVKNFGTQPPSLPLSGKATHCKIEPSVDICMCSCVLVCVWLSFLWFDQKTKHTHKRRLREEIKSSFFSRNSQLISNSTMCKTHSTRYYEHTYRKRAYGHSVVYVVKTTHICTRV